MEEGIILLWKRFLQVAFNRSYCGGIPTKCPALHQKVYLVSNLGGFTLIFYIFYSLCAAFSNFDILASKALTELFVCLKTIRIRIVQQ